MTGARSQIVSMIGHEYFQLFSLAWFPNSERQTTGRYFYFNELSLVLNIDTALGFFCMLLRTLKMLTSSSKKTSQSSFRSLRKISYRPGDFVLLGHISPHYCISSWNDKAKHLIYFLMNTWLAPVWRRVPLSNNHRKCSLKAVLVSFLASEFPPRHEDDGRGGV